MQNGTRLQARHGKQWKRTLIGIMREEHTRNFIAENAPEDQFHGNNQSTGHKDGNEGERHELRIFPEELRRVKTSLPRRLGQVLEHFFDLGFEQCGARYGERHRNDL